MKPVIVDALILLALLSLFGWLYVGAVASTPYVYDESDYMYAASLGWPANYADRPTLSFPDFLRAGLSRAKRSSLSEFIRDSNDIVFYRHWHGPILAYWLMAIGGRHLDEFGTRSSMIVFHLLTFLLIYAGCREILPGAEGRLAAVLCSAMYLMAFSNIKAACEVVPHSIFVLSYVASLFCLAKIAAGGMHWRYLMAVAAALAFCSLEVTLALLAAVPIWCFVLRKQLFAGWTRAQRTRFAAGPVVTFVATVLLLWPGAWLKLSFLKAYLFMAYLAVAQKAAWGSTISVPGTWRLRFTTSPVEWILIALAFGSFFVLRKRPSVRPALPFLIYGCCMIILVARVNTEEPRYLSPFLPALQIFTGMIVSLQLSRFSAAFRAVAACVLILGLAWNSHRQFLANPIHRAPVESFILASLRQQDLRGKSILVPSVYVPMLHYYFPGVRVRGYAEESTVPDAIRDGAFAGVLYTGAEVRFQSLSEH